MKNRIKIYLVLFLAVIYACDDPYKDSTFTVYDEVPIASYLESRPDVFSEWVKILKYADLFNALNQANEVFTLFAPTNEAVYAFYENKKVSSIEELGLAYTLELVKYHIVNDSIPLDDFIAGGTISKKTLTDDFLEVVFSDESGGEGGQNSLYINGEAHVKELAVEATNGLIYVMNDVIRPMIESVYEQMYDVDKNNILIEAMTLTGWNKELSVIADTVIQSSTGLKVEQRRYYTVLAVPDEVYQANGINSVEDLVRELGAGNDYTNPDNELYRYVGYHILNGNYKTADLKTFDLEDSTCKLWTTSIPNTLIKISREGDGIYYLNAEGEKATFTTGSDHMVKNGYFHQLDGVLPICEKLDPVPVYFEPTDYPELASYIATNGVENQIYRTMYETSELYTIIPQDLECYSYQVGPMGSPYANSPLAYWTGRGNMPNGLHDALYYDTLVLGLGYMGHVTMDTPPIIPGKYKVSMSYIYVGTMRPFLNLEQGNGGQTIFEFTDTDYSVIKAIYSSLPEDDPNNMFLIDLFDEVEFTELSTHPLKITVNDPAASLSKNYRIHIDYILFEPIN